ncbi:endonuclease YncB(thermonuclease family) [Mycoplasmopsis mustelae]|uniref:Endonuclease YncB(Thermonuclease family) n=1 Tax=Mycoplasmopsis mustelae TaxID=171289 RepID=A0A4R7UCJ6_9BACT|nr:thermonuclease family protein [Mycoplasmopsis mustelae]TDV24158.1 endonuclease YncB(thermonuclease family) [Mycoplasmopsis mustelae]
MRKKYRKILGFYAFATLITPLTIATSCGSNIYKETNKIKETKKENTEEPAKPLINAESLNYKVDNNLISFPLVFKSLNSDSYILTSSEDLSKNTFKRVQYNKAINKMQDEISREIKSQFKDQIHFTFKQPVKTLSKVDEQNSKFPKDINIQIFNDYAVLKFNSVRTQLVLDGINIQDKESQESKWDSKGVKNKIFLNYSLYYKAKKVNNIIPFSLEFEKNIVYPTPVDALKVDIDENNFQSLNLDFNSKKLKDISFKASLVSVSDGDTFSVLAKENKIIGNVNVEKGQTYKLRLRGIDTPEKGVGAKDGYKYSGAFEYHFALKSTEFAEKFFNKYKDDVLISFVDGKDTYNRTVGEIIFGKDETTGNYKYSYSTEIVRAGLTLPLEDSTWSNAFIHNEEDSYIYIMYPKMSEAANQAYQQQLGFFKYFNEPLEISLYVYGLKRNSGYGPFYDDGVDEIKVKDFISKKGD